jgi:hypothetical protein
MSNDNLAMYPGYHYRVDVYEVIGNDAENIMYKKSLRKKTHKIAELVRSP